MPKTKLGRLKSLSFKDIFTREDKDFTPWLCDNIALLGECVDMNLQVIKTESHVGSFRVDILARNIQLSLNGADFRVCIENQKGLSDHKHLGQILAYMAGKEANAVIWVAEQFRDEHIQTLKFLNEHSDESVNFFAVTFQCFQIDDSKPVVVFNKVVWPSRWLRAMKSDSQKNILNYQFWYAFLEEARKQGLNFFNGNQSTYNSWFNKSIELEPNVLVEWSTVGKKFRFGLMINTGDREKNTLMAENFKKYKTSMEKDSGLKLKWDMGDNRDYKYICAEFPHPEDFILSDILNNEDILIKAIKWGLDVFERTRATFEKHYRLCRVPATESTKM
ncbi:MAG: DUF4268 domain-containing protein [Promethearchaeota archaeon]